jgi:hypothetical protein
LGAGLLGDGDSAGLEDGEQRSGLAFCLACCLAGRPACCLALCLSAGKGLRKEQFAELGFVFLC